MADGVTIDILNEGAFNAALVDAARAAAEPRLALDAAARQLVDLARQSAPIDTGRLAGSQRAEGATAARVRVTADTPYAAVIHWGWPGHGIRRQPWIVATWLRNPAIIDAMSSKIQGELDKAASKAPPAP